jgi:hypothetical protein
MEWEYGLSWEWIILLLSFFSALWLVRSSPAFIPLHALPLAGQGEKPRVQLSWETRPLAQTHLTPRRRLGNSDDDEDVSSSLCFG